MWFMNPTHRGIGPVHATPNIFAPASTPADLIHHLSLFVLAICGAIFLVVSGLLLYSAVKFRRRADDDGREPAQIYGTGHSGRKGRRQGDAEHEADLRTPPGFARRTG
jgi:membrane protein implicated in regulation of membrane protease activity